MAKKKAAKKTAEKAKPSKARKELIPIVALGGLNAPIIGSATEAEVTEEEFARLRQIKVNGKHYVERR